MKSFSAIVNIFCRVNILNTNFFFALSIIYFDATFNSKYNNVNFIEINNRYEDMTVFVQIPSCKKDFC